MTVTIAPFLLYKNGTVRGIASHLGEMCEEMIGLCGLSSWDAPTPVQCIVLYCPDGLGSVVYAQVYGLSVLGSHPGQHCVVALFLPSALS